MKHVVFLGVMPRGSCKNSRRFGGTYRLHFQGNDTQSIPSSQRGYASRLTAKRASCKRPINNNLKVTDKHDRGGAVARGSRRRPSRGISSLRAGKTKSLVNLKMEALCSSETYFLTTATRRHIPEDNILHCYRREQHPRRQRSLYLQSRGQTAVTGIHG
jgi:hypothetical protein